MTKELLRYHRQIAQRLDCPKPMRDKFLADARHMTDNFFAENPEATLDELQSAIGEPDTLAAMFLDNADSDIVKGYRKKKSQVKRLAVILLAAAFIVATALAIYVFKLKQDAVITKESTIIIYETKDGINIKEYEKLYGIDP